MIDMTNAITRTVPISVFNRGQAGRIFETVRQDGARVVIKNNTPECVLLSPEEYVSLVEEINDARLFMMAMERLENGGEERAVPADEFHKRLGVTEEDLKGYEEVELE